MAYTTAALVEAELSSAASFSTSSVPTLAQLTTWIAETDATIDQLSANVYAQSTYVEEINYDGDDRIVLKHAPIISVTSVQYNPYQIGTTEYSTGWTTKTAETDYTIFKEKGYLEILSPWSPRTGSKQIKVTYVAGYATTPPQLQMLATKMVAKRVIDSVMNKDLKEKQSGKSISVGSISIVKPTDFGVSSYKTLTSTIDDLKKELIKGPSAFRYINY
jgi:hypothetical protein